MPTYISCGRWTTQGAQSVKESPSRLDASKKALESMGVHIKEFFMTMGENDVIVICEAPDDSTHAQALLSLLSKGSLTTRTARAFTEDEYREIISKLP